MSDALWLALFFFVLAAIGFGYLAGYAKGRKAKILDVLADLVWREERDGRGD